MKLAICIPTYQRTHLLELLLDDLTMQTRRADTLVIVDGDPSSGMVLQLLQDRVKNSDEHFIYVPSNHGNLAYQRYLGYCKAISHELLLYLDDDQRIEQSDAVERVLYPLQKTNSEFVAGTAITRFPRKNITTTDSKIDLLIRLFGAARHLNSGSLTPAGHRIQPCGSDGDYALVEWLQGRIMAFRLDALETSCFSDDLFALTHIGCGMGEDTYLGRSVRHKGKLFFARCAIFEHPDADTPKAYPTARYRKGRADAYSRRFLNDHYRGRHPPYLADRIALLRSWLGALIIALGKAIGQRSRDETAYALGYGMGILKGIFQPPRAVRLTPTIDWWNDAETALRDSIIIENRR